MSSIKENIDVACFHVTKHSWKGKYKRIFSVGTLGITTYNPGSFESTNQWPYSEFMGITPNIKVSGEFIITIKKGKKVETMRFSSEHRADILTETLKFCSLFADTTSKESCKYDVYKYHWSDTRLPVVLEVKGGSLDQCDPTMNIILASYDYKDMEAIILVSDYPGGFAIKHGGFGRLHMFVSDCREEITKKICDNAFIYIGVIVRQKKDLLTVEEFIEQRLGKFSTDEAITPMVEFNVEKICHRYTDPTRRILSLSEECIVERDPNSYVVTTCKPLCEVFSIVRYQDNPQLFSIEYIKGQVRTYTSTDRDSLLASLIDGVRASGNASVYVQMSRTSRKYRLGPFTVPVDEEVESTHLKLLQQQLPAGWSFASAIQRFNANLPYSGLLHAVTQDGLFAENKDKLIHAALNAILDNEGNQDVISNEELEGQFHALRRLVASKAGFASFTNLPKFKERLGLKVIKALKRSDFGVTYAAVDTICALMEPMHVDYDLRQQQLNKTSLLSSKHFLESLMDMFFNLVMRGSGALVIAAMLDFLNYALCAPYSETTDGNQFDALLEMVASRGRILFKLLQHPSMAIVKGAGLVLKAIIEEGDSEIAAKMQDLALAEGALPRHLHIAMFTNSNDSRMLTNRQLSRHLVGLWVTGHPAAMGLLRRILPSGLLSFLDSDEKITEKEVDRMHIRDNLKLAQDHSNKTRRNPHWKLIEKHVEEALRHWRARIGVEKEDKLRERPIVLRKRRERIKIEANWELFYWKFNEDHAKTNLIWNYKTREELREALEEEIRAFNVDKELGGSNIMSWNYQEFEIQYRCLADEIKIGDYYLRLLLEEEHTNDLNFFIKRSCEFFYDLYHRFLLSSKVSMRCMCLQAMTIVYGRYYEEIGVFHDIKYIIGMLIKCTDRQERDRLILFLNKLILIRKNVTELLDANGVKILVEFLPLSHLHVSRATIPAQTNVIECSSEMMNSYEKEWYYGNSGLERLGPCSFPEMKQLWLDGTINANTKCWAQGMDGWQPLHVIAQLKWSVMAENNPVFNESDLAVLILNMLIRICEYFPSRDIDGAIIRPLPRAKRLLSDPVCLPHIVQLLLTFEPILVEKVATLLYIILQDNSSVSQLYLSGFFFFILMYTGSNVVPVIRVLQYTHVKQAFCSDDMQCSDITVRSILGRILPEAMICYLENYGADKFSETFLGDFDTPEVIWNGDMRRLMIQKLSSHVADFSPRLLSNIRALYQYCPIPVIVYPQLENELFCNMYYLRHLCDTDRFLDWPIKEPVKLVKEVLDLWKKESEKKPSSMSVEDAFETLCLETGVSHDDGNIRKAYFRLAQKHHPDKNPDGREMFEKVNKAYEFLCSRSSRATEGPDPVNIVLILRVQSILFKRYKEVLHPYKYAGYPMLIKAIKMETDDDLLFSKQQQILDAATELTYYTINCSVLNAEELRRDYGLELLQQAFSRCVSILSHSSDKNDVAIVVCSNIARCFAAASEFEACRKKIMEMPELISDLCRILYYKHLPKLCATVTECICAFAVDGNLQTLLLHAGVLWHILPFLFNYDYTLEEGGVERTEETNSQEVSNRLAVLSIQACMRLGGYNTGKHSTPENEDVRKALKAMLTPYITLQFYKQSPTEILKLLNSNTENPYFIWENSARAELVEYLEAQHVDKTRMGESDPLFGAEFLFSIHKKELYIGSVFVRIYNEQPTFPIENAKSFTIDLLDYLSSQDQYLHSLVTLAQNGSPNMLSNDHVLNVEMALKALSNVIKNYAGVEIQCIGHFKMLFCFLQLNGCAIIQQLVLEIILGVTSNKECIKDISAMEVLPYLLLVLHSLLTERLTVLDILHSLTSNTAIVKECLSKGAVIYLLDQFCNSSDVKLRLKTAELLSKMVADKLVGPKLKILLSKFLPPIFMDAMRDSAETSIHMFEGTQENPEIIWNDDVRKKVCSVVTSLKNKHLECQRNNPQTLWKLPNDFSNVYSGMHNEIVVSGVYLRLFLKNPSWVIRKPKEFLGDLLCTCLDLMNRDRTDNEMLEIVTSAIVSLFQAQPTLADLVPNQGHIPRMLNAIGNKNDVVPKYCLIILHQLAHNKLCVQNLAHCDCISPIKEAMKIRTDMTGVACETLYLIFEKQHEELVNQALKADLIPYLLTVLESGLENVENPSSTKAQIVKALKSASRSVQYGDKVNSILEQSKIWAEYKDQKHDLFITTTSTAGYLTAASPGVAGYLMQGTTKAMPSSPPPIS